MAIPTSNGAASSSKKRKRVAVEEPTRRPKSRPKDVPVVTKAVIIRPAPKSNKPAKLPSDGSDEDEEEDEDEDEDMDGDSDEEDATAMRQAGMLQLEEEIIKAKTAADESEEVVIMTAVGLCRTFCRIMSRGQLTRHKDHSPEELKMVKEGKEAYINYLNGLGSLLEGGEGTSLKLAMRLLKEESTHMKPSEDYYFPFLTYGLIIKYILLSDSPDLVTVFATEYVYEYLDLRLEFFKAIPNLCKDVTASNTTFSENLCSVLYDLKAFPTTSEELTDSTLYISAPSKKKHPLFQIATHQRYFQETWLAFLSRPLPSKQRDILTILPKRIIPHFPNPRLLMDYLTDTYNTGGVTALLALQGLFNLMMSHNLDYPNFFPKLYALLDGDPSAGGTRGEFYKTDGETLSIRPAERDRYGHSIYLQFDEVAPHIKDGFVDPFDEEEADPMKTRALESSLWEFETLQSHYHPNVATLAKILSEQFTKQQYNMEDFLDHSYTSMLEAEMEKKTTKDPVVEYIVPKKILYPEEKKDNDPQLVERENVLLDFWDFE
ncbi:hypothetical protein AA313_de0204324 [Arthrobotrys entomopaga]|nr:hypothetical protein AA313_de0204324 [Arthrobotrys entomopaga]